MLGLDSELISFQIRFLNIYFSQQQQQQQQKNSLFLKNLKQIK